MLKLIYSKKRKTKEGKMSFGSRKISWTTKKLYFSRLEIKYVITYTTRSLHYNSSRTGSKSSTNVLKIMQKLLEKIKKCSI